MWLPSAALPPILDCSYVSFQLDALFLLVSEHSLEHLVLLSERWQFEQLFCLLNCYRLHLTLVLLDALPIHFVDVLLKFELLLQIHNLPLQQAYLLRVHQFFSDWLRHLPLSRVIEDQKVVRDKILHDFERLFVDFCAIVLLYVS